MLKFQTNHYIKPLKILWRVFCSFYLCSISATKWLRILGSCYTLSSKTIRLQQLCFILFRCELLKWGTSCAPKFVSILSQSCTIFKEMVLVRVLFEWQIGQCHRVSFRSYMIQKSSKLTGVTIGPSYNSFDACILR